MTIHRHHVIPKHVDKSITNEEWNIAHLTLAEHADAHFIRWLVHRDEYDRIAWLSMTGLIPRAEATRLAQIAHGKSHKGMRIGSPSEEKKQKLRAALLLYYATHEDKRKGKKQGSRPVGKRGGCPKGTKMRARSLEHCKKLSEARKGKPHPHSGRYGAYRPPGLIDI